MCSDVVDVILLPFDCCIGRHYEKDRKYKKQNDTPHHLSPEKLYDMFHPVKYRPEGHFIKIQHFTDTHGKVHEYRRCSALRHNK